MVDLGSTNGSRINGVRVSHQELADGDELTFGNTESASKRADAGYSGPTKHRRNVDGR